MSNISICHNNFNSIQYSYYHLEWFSIFWTWLFRRCLLHIYCIWERVNHLPSFKADQVWKHLRKSNIAEIWNLYSFDTYLKTLWEKKLYIMSSFSFNSNILKKQSTESKLTNSSWAISTFATLFSTLFIDFNKTDFYILATMFPKSSAADL